MKFLKVASSEEARKYFTSEREIVSIHDKDEDIIDLGAVVLMEEDMDFVNKLKEAKLDIPVFVVSDYENDKDAANAVDLKEVDFIIDVNNSNFEYNSKIRICNF